MHRDKLGNVIYVEKAISDESIREAVPGDRWLLCSDGLSGPVSAATIGEVLAGVEDPELAAEQLIDLAEENTVVDCRRKAKNKTCHHNNAHGFFARPAEVDKVFYNNFCLVEFSNCLFVNFCRMIVDAVLRIAEIKQAYRIGEMFMFVS